MDRKLIAITTLLLTLQVALLLTDWPGVSHDGDQKENSAGQPIGFVLETKQAVKRRAHNSVVWEDSNATETLLSYDTLLTLENSSAELNLQGDVHLSIHENTLIVLEPPLPENPNLLRIRFARGQLLTQNKNRALRVDAKEWSLEAVSGSDISIKSLEGEKVEVEVHKGTVALQGENKTAPAQKVAEGTRFQISGGGEVSNKIKLSEAIRFANPAKVHIYTHEPKSDFDLEWQGEATALRQVTANQEPIETNLGTSANKKELELAPGTHYLSVKAPDGSYSSEVVVSVSPAPQILYTSPLPRDRFAQNSEVYYSWMPLAGAKSYHIELYGGDGAAASREEYDSHQPFIKTRSALEGPIFFRVFGVDEDGFRIPPQYALPIYFVRDPLAPPQLLKPQMAPQIRAPANKKDESFLEKIWHTFVETTAFADEKPGKRLVVFAWQPVLGADFYNIEISSTPDFSKPEVIVKVARESFSWSEYDKKTYYWRVAAGVNSGRMGLFSEVAKVDLSLLDSSQDGEIAPGVTLATTEATEKPVKKMLKAKDVTPVETQAAPAPNVATAPAVTPPPQTTPAPLPTLEPQAAQDKVWRLSPWAQYDFDYITSSMEGPTFTATQQGLENAAASLWMSGERDDGITYLGQLRLAFVKWEPTSNATFPQQTSWTETYYALRLWREHSDDDWGWGVVAENMIKLNRDGVGNLDPETIWQAGPSFSFHSKFLDNLTVHASGSVLVGGNIVTLSTANTIDYTFQNRKFKPYIGGEFDLKMYFGSDSYSGDDLSAGFHVGIHFK